MSTYKKVCYVVMLTTWKPFYVLGNRLKAQTNKHFTRWGMVAKAEAKTKARIGGFGESFVEKSRE